MKRLNQKAMDKIIDDVRAQLNAKGIKVNEAANYIDEDMQGRNLYIIEITANDRVVQARTVNSSKEDTVWSIQGCGDGFSTFKQWQAQGVVYQDYPRDIDIVETIVKYLTEEGFYK